MITNLIIEDVLNAYKEGLFPMAEERDSPEIRWYDPVLRGQLPIQTLHIPDRLRRTLLKEPYTIKVNSDFKKTITSCAKKTSNRPETWINETIIDLFHALHLAGHAHSLEAWDEEEMVGGLYGLSIGSAFFGESMFSTKKDASKICLVHLCARLWKSGFKILDTQFINGHLIQFGAYELSRKEYLRQLNKAVLKDSDFLLTQNKPFSEIELVKTYLKENKITSVNKKVK
jgi:leucyl/phenylalanyl-tRNA--protein transferase